MTSTTLSFDAAFAAFVADRRGQAIQARQEAGAQAGDPEPELEAGP